MIWPLDWFSLYVAMSVIGKNLWNSCDPYFVKFWLFLFCVVLIKINSKCYKICFTAYQTTPVIQKCCKKNNIRLLALPSEFPHLVSNPYTTYPWSRDRSWFTGFPEFSEDRSGLTGFFLIKGVPGVFRSQIQAHRNVLDSRGPQTFPETESISQDRSWFKGSPDFPETDPRPQDGFWFKGPPGFSGDRSELTGSFLIQGVPGLFRRPIRAHKIVLDSRGPRTFSGDRSELTGSFMQGVPGHKIWFGIIDLECICAPPTHPPPPNLFFAPR